MARKHALRALALVCCLLSASMASCQPAPPPAEPAASSQKPVGPVTDIATVVLDPEPRYAAPYPVEAYGMASDRLISPSGNYLLALLEGQRIAALPLRAGLGEKTLFEQAPPALPPWERRVLLGWTSTDKCLFIVGRAINDESNSEARALSLQEGCVADSTSHEVASFPLPPGVVKKVAWNRQTHKILVHVSGAIWEMDAGNGTSRVLRANLPSWDGLFQALPSPSGNGFVYNMPLDSTNALTLLNTGTGAESRIHPDELGRSFYPQWSPDGRYIVAYLAAPTSSAGKQSGQEFDLIPYEDGPYAAARSLVLYDSKTGSHTTVAADGKWIFQPRWSWDSSRIFFSTGTAHHNPAALFPESVTVSMDEVWAVDVDRPSSAVKVAGVDSLPSGVMLYIEEISMDGQMAFLNVSEAGHSSFWRLEVGKDPSKIAGGDLSYHYGVRHGSYVARTVDTSEGTVHLWLFGPGPDGRDARPVLTAKEATDMFIMAYDDSLLVLAVRQSKGGVLSENDTWVLAVYQWVDLLP